MLELKTLKVISSFEIELIGSMFSVGGLRGLVLFQRQISILLDCSCIGSTVMPRGCFFLGWFVCLFVFSLPLSLSLSLLRTCMP